MVSVVWVKKIFEEMVSIKFGDYVGISFVYFCKVD